MVIPNLALDKHKLLFGWALKFIKRVLLDASADTFLVARSHDP